MDIQEDFGLEEEQSQTNSYITVWPQLDQASRKYGLEINIDKTKLMATQNIIYNITMNGTPVEK